MTHVLPTSVPNSWAIVLERPSGPGQSPAPRPSPLSSAGTWQADDNIVGRRNTPRRRLSSSSLEDPEDRPCVWGPLAV